MRDRLLVLRPHLLRRPFGLAMGVKDMAGEALSTIYKSEQRKHDGRGQYPTGLCKYPFLIKSCSNYNELLQISLKYVITSA